MWNYNQQNAFSTLKRTRNSIIGICVSVWIMLSLLISLALWLTLPNAGMPIGLSLVFLALWAVIICVWATAKVRADLKSADTTTLSIRPAKVVLNESVPEAGSGMLYIPLLADVFPKLYGQRMKTNTVSYVITETGEKYFIPDTAQQDSRFVLHFAKRSGIYLGCEVK